MVPRLGLVRLECGGASGHQGSGVEKAKVVAQRWPQDTARHLRKKSSSPCWKTSSSTTNDRVDMVESTHRNSSAKSKKLKVTWS